jgi:hypothetical protein
MLIQLLAMAATELASSSSCRNSKDQTWLCVIFSIMSFLLSSPV